MYCFCALINIPVSKVIVFYKIIFANIVRIVHKSRFSAVGDQMMDLIEILYNTWNDQ